MQPLAQPEPRGEGGNLFGGAVQGPVAEHAAQGHLLLLAAAVAGPVKPVQVAGVGEGVAGVNELPRGFAPVGLPSVKFHQQGHAPGHGGHQCAWGELAHAQGLALVLQPQRGVDAEGELSVFWGASPCSTCVSSY